MKNNFILLVTLLSLTSVTYGYNPILDESKYVNTIAGNLEIKRFDLDNNWVILNDKIIVKSNDPHVTVEKKYDLKNSTILILSENAGGASTLPYYSIIHLFMDSTTIVSKKMYSYDNVFKVTLYNNEITINLGYDSGFKKIAVYKDKNLKINKTKVQGPANVANCNYLYTNVYSDFIDTQLCTDDPFETQGMATSRSIEAMKHDPRMKIDQLSFLSRKGCAKNKKLSFNGFNKEICIVFGNNESNERSCYAEYLLLGNLSNDKKKYKDASFFYFESYKCAEKQKEKITSLASLSASEYSLGDIDSSIKHIKELLSISPSNKWALEFNKKILNIQRTKNTKISAIQIKADIINKPTRKLPLVTSSNEITRCFEKAWGHTSHGGFGLTRGGAIDLCKGASNANEVAKCFIKAWGHVNNQGFGLTRGNAIELCRGVKNSTKVTQCFETAWAHTGNGGLGLTRGGAIDLCKK